MLDVINLSRIEEMVLPNRTIPILLAGYWLLTVLLSYFIVQVRNHTSVHGRAVSGVLPGVMS